MACRLTEPDRAPTIDAINGEWVSIIPIGGVSATWDKWVELPTGAFVSTSHDLGPFTTEVTDLDAAATLADLVDGPDPFEVLSSP